VSFQPISYALNIDLSNPYFSNLERRMLWETVTRALQKARLMTSIALPLPTELVTSSQKATRLVTQALPLVKPYWLS